MAQAPTGRDPIGHVCTKKLATETPKPPEGFETFDNSGYDGEPTVKLNSGETLCGVVLELTEGEHDDGRMWYRLRVKDQDRGTVRYFAADRVRTAARDGRIEEGEPIWIGRAAEQDSFVDDDGETVDYLPTDVAFPGGAD